MHSHSQQGNSINQESGDVRVSIKRITMSQQKASESASTNVDIEAVSRKQADFQADLPKVPEAKDGGDNNEDLDVGYITQLDKDGNIQQVPIKFEGTIPILGYF